jgi:hypothetical protein
MSEEIGNINVNVNSSPFVTNPGYTQPNPDQQESNQAVQSQGSDSQSDVVSVLTLIAKMLPSLSPLRAMPKQKQLFLSSENRSAGKSNDAFYLLDCGIHCHRRPGEHITITPLFFSMMRGWDIISASNRRFNLIVEGVAYECKMKIGSGYTCVSFAEMLQSAINELLPKPLEFFVIYDKVRNRYTFIPPDDRTYNFGFTHKHQTIFFGFPSDMDISPPFSNLLPLRSQNNVSMSPQVVVVLRTNLVTANVYDNFQGPGPINTGVILAVPIACEPYDEIQYQAQTPDSGTMRLLTDSVHSIQIAVTDETGDFLECGDYVLGLRFDIYPPS